MAGYYYATVAIGVDANSKREAELKVIELLDEAKVENFYLTDIDNALQLELNFE